MTYAAFTTEDYASFACEARSRQPVSQLALFVTALALSLTAGVGLLHLRDRSSRADTTVALAPAAVAPAVTLPRRAATLQAAIPPLRRYAGMLSPPSTAREMPVTFARSAPLRTGFEPARPPASDPVVVVAHAEPATTVPALPATSGLIDIPLPAPRPALLPPAESAPRGSARRAPTEAEPALPAAPGDARGLLEKIFGAGDQSRPALAYAPADGGLGAGGRIGAYDRWTAVYDIAAHTVYLPDGRRLEAHSGLGSRLDDPRSVTERMRGATPPAVYELSLRESLFHGVRALRLNPVDTAATFGRGGLLAHTFMLGPRGDSNGCVVFRDYQSFVQAFDRGEIKRLAVVASLR